MRIDSSQIELASQHISLRQTSIEESLRMWRGAQRPDFEGKQRHDPAATTHATISDAARQAATAAAEKAESTEADDATQAIDDAVDEANNDPHLKLLLSIVEAMLGRRVQLFDNDELTVEHSDDAQAPVKAADAAAPERAGWGLEYDRSEREYEFEKTSFAASGVVRTSDGKEIQFNVALDMQREYLHESHESIRAGDAVRKDPLVINFNGTAAQLSDRKFAFDLDSDGSPENIASLGSGSGYLVFDKNRNGTIDDGSELFGTRTGNGFAELAGYDDDRNGWIDENDAIFQQLQVWNRDAAGNDALSTLAQRNVGALYLANASTPFDLKDAANQQQGQIRSSGIYLREDGGTGTLQQVDLFV